MVVPKRYVSASLDLYRTPTEAHERLLELVKQPIKNNIIVSGNVGVGKTFLAWSIYNSTSRSIEIGGKKARINDKCKVVTIKDLIDDIRASWKNKKHERTNYKEVPLLIIDELGIQYGTDSERIELFELFDYRYNNELPIIALSNLSKDKMLPILGKRIIDRLYAEAHVFELDCGSMR